MNASSSRVEDVTAHPGLLSEIMSNTLDQDYRVAAARSAKRRDSPRHSRGLTGAVVVAMFGGMIGISVLRTEQQRPIADAERAQLVAQIHLRQNRLDALHGTLASLDSSVAALQSSASVERNLERQTATSLTQFAGVSGAGPVSGPGLEITTDDAPDSLGSSDGGVILDTDLQSLVNALWTAGAEAITINGNRLTSLTAIRFAGRAITVDYRSLTPPYVIDAIGDPNTLPARLLETPGGQAWLGLKENYGITFDTAPSADLLLPGDPEVQIRQATPVGTR